PGQPNLSAGAWSAVITGDRPLGTIVRADWLATGGAAMYSDPIPGTDVLLPLAMKRYYSQSSLVSVQNVDTTRTDVVHVDLYRAGSSQVAKAIDLSLCAGTSATLDLSTDPRFADVTDGFLGWMRFKGDGPVAVQSYVDIAASSR